MQNFFGNSDGKSIKDTPPLKPFQALRAYWEGLRLNGGLPDRARIDPRGLSDHLEHLLLVERVAPGHGRLRLAGSAVHDILGMEARGMPLTALLEPTSRARFSERWDAVFHDTAILAHGKHRARLSWCRAPGFDNGCEMNGVPVC